VEIVTVYGARLFAIWIYRFVLPGLFLMGLLWRLQTQPEINASDGLLCLSAAWLVMLLIMLTAALWKTPPECWTAQPEFMNKRWLSRSLPLLASSLMMTAMTSTGTIILEILHPSEAIVGSYAIAMQTSSLISLIGTSTNRYYLPMEVILLERRESAQLYRLMRQRFRLIGGIILLFLLSLGQWGHEILALFGTQFSDEWLALLIAASGASFSTLFADAPYCLQFMGHNRLVLSIMAVAVLLMLVMSVVLGQAYGAVGVAIAYAAPTALLFSAFQVLALTRLRRVFHSLPA
jgi:O-antigen/teichoic acid export membrane protein